jgi:hypothetical protein
MYVECKNKNDNSNNKDNWYHLTIIHKMHEQHTCKALGTTEKSYTGHCAHTSKSTNVKVQNVYHGN